MNQFRVHTCVYGNVTANSLYSYHKLTKYSFLISKRQEGKTGLVRGWAPVGQHKEKVKEIRWKYFVFMYENRTMRAVETALRRGRGKKREG
jgi:hypothetical protein